MCPPTWQLCECVYLMEDRLLPREHTTGLAGIHHAFPPSHFRSLVLLFGVVKNVVWKREEVKAVPAISDQQECDEAAAATAPKARKRTPKA